MNQRKILKIILPLLWLAVLGSATAAVYARYQARVLFARLEKRNAQRDALDTELGRLELEQSTWSSNAFVEKMANEKLHMMIPQPNDVRIVRP